MGYEWAVENWGACSNKCWYPMEEEGKSTRGVSCIEFDDGVQKDATRTSSDCTGAKPETSRGCNMMPCGSSYLRVDLPLKIPPSAVMKSVVLYRAFETRLLAELQGYLHSVDLEFFRLLTVDKYDIASRAVRLRSLDYGSQGALVTIQISEDTSTGAMSLQDIAKNLLKLDDVDVSSKLSSLLRQIDHAKFDTKSVAIVETEVPSVQDLLQGISAAMWAVIGSSIFVVVVSTYCACRWWKTRKRGYRRHSDMEGFGGGSF